MEQTTDPWTQVRTLLRMRAEQDLREGGAGLYVAAGAGPVPLFLASSRPFAKGEYADPIIELVALALALKADRLAVGAVARAWSLDDPVVPVIGDEDLRQRVLTVHAADAHGRNEPIGEGYLIPFDVAGDGTVAWQDEVAVGTGEGWISMALDRLLTFRDHAEAPRVDPQAQLERCLSLGHDVGVTPESATRFFPAEFVAADRSDG